TSSGTARLVTGLGGAAAKARVEALAAGAALDSVGVDDGKAAAHQAVDEIDLRTAQILQREGIDDHLDARLLDDLVVIGRLDLERHAVRKARTAAWRNEDAQRTIRRLLTLENAAQALDSFLGQGQGAHGPNCSIRRPYAGRRRF